uniref:Uncharacterized protein n=1 Tax=Tanacetum cinerariifolium TaxID=118510 RepID=A0A6L2MSB0_TANCI|nr:hypothetical protein [Tanacetum cinerariifolium]
MLDSTFVTGTVEATGGHASIPHISATSDYAIPLMQVGFIKRSIKDTNEYADDNSHTVFGTTISWLAIILGPTKPTDAGGTTETTSNATFDAGVAATTDYEVWVKSNQKIREEKNPANLLQWKKTCLITLSSVTRENNLTPWIC